MTICHARRKERLADLQTHGGALAGCQSFNVIRWHAHLSLLDLPTRRMLCSLQTDSTASKRHVLLASLVLSALLLPPHKADWLLLARVVACCTLSHYWPRGVHSRFITGPSRAITIQHLLAVPSLCLRPKPTLCLVQCALLGMMGGPCPPALFWLSEVELHLHMHY